MPISSKSRDVVRLEHARASPEPGKACQREVEQLRATMTRGGGMDAVIEDRQIDCTRQSFNAWREAYVRAFETEGQPLTTADVVNVETTQLFGELRATINREIQAGEQRDELLREVDEMEKAQRTPGFLQRYQGFVAALADHITSFQAFLPALLQLTG